MAPPKVQGPFDEATRKFSVIRDKMLLDGLKSAQPGTVMGAIAEFHREGIIDMPQCEALALGDPRRTIFELQMIANLVDEGAIFAGNPSLFEEVQAKGSQFFFENFSPLALWRQAGAEPQVEPETP